MDVREKPVRLDSNNIDMIEVSVMNPGKEEQILCFPETVEKALEIIRAKTEEGGSVSVEITGLHANEAEKLVRACLPGYNLTTFGIEETLNP